MNYLRADGNWATPPDTVGTGMTLLGTPSLSGGAFTVTGIAAGYRWILIEYENLSTDFTTDIQVQISSTNGAAWGTAVSIATGISSSTQITGTAIIMNASSAITTKTLHYVNADANGLQMISTNTAAVVDAVRVIENAGSLDAGTVRIYGVK